MPDTPTNEETFEILMSTVNNHRLMVDNYNHVIINQILDETIQAKNHKNVFTYHEKGISRSRNRALEHAGADICLISDDDVRFKDNIDQKIISAFERNPDADIITFQIQTPSGEFYKEYPEEKFRHTKKSLMHVSSVEIAFKRKTVLEKQLQFDELFGLGAAFPTGEEFIFLVDALNKGLNILYLPEVVVIHPKESWSNKWNLVKHIKSKGALLYRVFGWKALFWVLLFSAKKHQSSQFTFLVFLKNMINGIIEYRIRRKN